MAARYHIAVIGGGTGGLVTAAAAAGVGARVVLFEEDRLGGECLWTGCVPSKALLRAARAAEQVRRASRFGIRGQEPVEVDLQAVMRHVREASSAIEHHDSPERFQEMGVEVVRARARIAGPHTVEADGRIWSARRIVLATGSRTRVPPIEGLQGVPWIDHEGLFELEELPPRLLVAGAGPVGTETAQAFARLGSRVTLVGSAGRILPGDDPEVSGHIRRVLEAEGVEVRTGQRVVQARREGAEIVVGIASEQGDETEAAGDLLLLATGKRPRIEGLGLEEAGVRVEDGVPWTDPYLRTSVKTIFAVGDVNGRHLFTHTAEHEAKAVVQSALSPLKKRVDYRTLNWCTFTDPEAAHVGASEQQAREQAGRDLVVARYEFSELDRAVTDGSAEGFIKIYAGRKGRILGADIVGPSAGELIQTVGLAMHEKIPLTRFTEMIRLYPTLTEGIHRAADAYRRRRFEGSLGQRILRAWLALLR